MSRAILIRPTSSTRRRALLASESSSSGAILAEAAGGTTAECAAVCCCCPCGLANFVFLVVYKVPAGLVRRAVRNKRRQRLIKEGLLPPSCHIGSDETDKHLIKIEDELEMWSEKSEMLELEKEMWETFYGAGFWRSASQKEPVAAVKSVDKELTLSELLLSSDENFFFS